MKKTILLLSSLLMTGLVACESTSNSPPTTVKTKTSTTQPSATPSPTQTARKFGVLTTKEQELADLINAYRKEKGLKPIPISPMLSTVAQKHSEDQQKNKPDEKLSPDGKECNLHSWSDKGEWKSCCYTDDHAKASCMWDKPKEITNHPGPGFEISTVSLGASIPAEGILRNWKASPVHDEVILNEKDWKENNFAGMGVGISEGARLYANVWFSEAPDPQ